MALYAAAVRGAGGDQPGCRRPLRGAGRDDPAAARGERGEDPVLGGRQPRAARPAQLDPRPGPAAARPAVRPAHRRAAPPGRAGPDSARRRCSTLVNELLDLAKAEAGRIEPRCQLVDLGRARRTAARRAAAHGRRGRRAGRRRCRRSGLDAAHRSGCSSTQVLRNLLSNAVKFTDARARCGCTADRRRAGDVIEVAVSDTGIGIPPRAPGAGLRGVLPGARAAAAGARGHRPRAALRPPGRHRAGRQPHAGQRAGPGHHPRAAAPRGAGRRRPRRATTTCWWSRTTPRSARSRTRRLRAVHANGSPTRAPAPRPCTSWPSAAPTS